MLLLLTALLGAPAMVPVGPGKLTPMYPLPGGAQELAVGRFWLDVAPVTQRDFLEFVRRAPQWSRARVPRIFAEDDYLAAWASSDELGAAVTPEAPVVQVSWFAARAYCEARGARLPSEAEWELAARADEVSRDASKKPEFRERILRWYTEPASAALGGVRRGRANAWGVHDLHGLVWEWVEDFNAGFASEDSRGTASDGPPRFCGGGALGASAREDYATLMRLAFRSSLDARYTTSRLGFRCAKDWTKK